LSYCGRSRVVARGGIGYGTAELVVQEAGAYQDLLDRLDELETLAALSEAAAEIDRGEGSSIEEAEARLREKLGIRKRVR